MDSPNITPPQPKSFTLKQLLPFLGILVAIAGLVTLAILSRNSLDNRQRAATSAGVVTISLKPASQLFAANTSQTIEVQTNTASARISGYELFIDFTGNVPSNLAYIPTNLSGLSTVTSKIESTSNGKRLTIGILTPIANPPKSFGTANGTITLGKLTFTTPSSGTMNVSLVSPLSRALLFNNDPNILTEKDVLKTMTPYTYTFRQPSTSTSTPVANQGTTKLKVISNQLNASLSFTATVKDKSPVFNVVTKASLNNGRYYSYSNRITQPLGTRVTYEAQQPPAGMCLKNVGVREKGKEIFSGQKCRFLVIPAGTDPLDGMGLFEFERCSSSNWAQTNCTYEQSVLNTVPADVSPESHVPSFKVGLALRTTGRYIPGYREIQPGMSIPNSIMQSATIYAYPDTIADIPLVKSVRFEIDGQLKRVDSTSIYSATEITGTSPDSLGLSPGSHTVKVTTYQGVNGGGAAGSPVSFSFTVK